MNEVSVNPVLKDYDMGSIYIDSSIVSSRYGFLLEIMGYLIQSNDIFMLTLNTCLPDTLSNREVLYGLVLNLISEQTRYRFLEAGVVFDPKMSVMEVSTNGLLHIHMLIEVPLATYGARSLLKLVRQNWRSYCVSVRRPTKHNENLTGSLANLDATLFYLSKQLNEFIDYFIPL